MEEIRFEWDAGKADANVAKLAVTSGEVGTVFEDEHARLRDDPEHSDDEDRFVLLGMSHRLRILVVVHCYRESDEVVRIISARRATPQEARRYEELQL